MSEQPSKAVSKSDAKAPAEGEGGAEGKHRWLSWAVGWVLVPGVIIGVLYLVYIFVLAMIRRDVAPVPVPLSPKKIRRVLPRRFNSSNFATTRPTSLSM